MGLRIVRPYKWENERKTMALSDLAAALLTRPGDLTDELGRPVPPVECTSVLEVTSRIRPGLYVYLGGPPSKEDASDDIWHFGLIRDPRWKITQVAPDKVWLIRKIRALDITGIGKLQKISDDHGYMVPERAPTGRSKCWRCVTPIPKGAVRYTHGTRARWGYSESNLCVPCAIKELEEKYNPVKKQLAIMRRYAGPYKVDKSAEAEFLEDMRAIIGADTK